MYSLQLANEIVRRSKNNNRKITNLSLQKLAFFSHGWYLAIMDLPLVEGEEFEAWRLGPVLPSLYHQFKGYSSNPIPADSPFFRGVGALPDNAEESQIIDKVLDEYGRFTGPELVRISHVLNGPWHNVWNDQLTGVTISDADIKEYFQLT